MYLGEELERFLCGGTDSYVERYLQSLLTMAYSGLQFAGRAHEIRDGSDPDPRHQDAVPLGNASITLSPEV